MSAAAPRAAPVEGVDVGSADDVGIGAGMLVWDVTADAPGKEVVTPGSYVITQQSLPSINMQQDPYIYA
jgi:hypothetical protein